MVKVRMNTADVAAEVKCLRNLIGMRCSNVYDISPKTYIFKLVSSSGLSESGESNKSFLLMESGIRLHTTAYIREKSNMPSGFTLKLRKHIRTRRLEDVRQLGYDRIILFQFGISANAHYIILELYSQGNIILTDANFMVLTLLRSHRDDDKGFAIMSRHQYPVESYRDFEHMTFEKLQQALSNINGADGDQVEEKNGIQSEQKSLITRGKQTTLKMVLGEVLGLGPALSEHVILDAGLVPSMKITKESEFDDGTVHILIKSITTFENWLVDVVSGGKIPEGYILMQKSQFGKNGGSTDQFGNMIQLYDEFCPLLLNQFKSRDSVMFEKFDAALDEFYSKIEAQRAEHNQKTKENSSMQKLNRIRVDQGNRVDLLRKEAEHSSKMAQLIEYNIEDIDAVIVAVRVALANGMSWQDVAHMVKEEKKAGNPVANIIGKLNLDRNCITLLLSNNLDEMDDNEKTLPVDEVDIDLSLSANANARKWYELKKKQEGKEEKTVTAHEKAFKAAEKKTRLLLSQEKSVAKISHMRKVHWFEKFNWFISSENYLVISGRDAQQNDIIVKRHMSKGDLYVHAELHGASSTIIKNHKPDLAVPPLTLNQAGCFTVCHSQAWDSKIVTSAWWVYPHQVSKTAPTGEYLTVGSFMIRGKKRFLPPHPLIMGFGLLFRFDESSLGSHVNERRVRGEDDVITGFEETSAMHEIPDSGSDAEMASFKDLEEAHTREISSTDHKIGSDSPTENGDHTRISEKPGFSEGLRSLNSDGDVLSTVFVDAFPPDCSGNIFSNIIEPYELTDRALELGLVGCQKKEDLLPTQEEKHDFVEAKGDMKGKPHFSKADRRKMKAGKIGNAKVTDCHGNNDAIGIVSPVDVNEFVGKPDNVKLSRGKRSKLKKIKQKYGDQDEEERRIRMSLLASAGKPEKVNKAVENTKNEPSAVPQILAGVDDAQKICYKCKKPGHLSHNCQEHVEGFRRKSKGMSGDDITNADLGVEDVTEEEYIVESDGEKREKVNDLDFFTGIPLSSDVLLYAVPVCAPYAALHNYKYKVKIVPGSSKKGKGVKTAMNLFMRMKEMTIREKQVMKACTDPELIAAMLGNVKITAPALSHLLQSQQKHKKHI